MKIAKNLLMKIYYQEIEITYYSITNNNQISYKLFYISNVKNILLSSINDEINKIFDVLNSETKMLK